MQENVPMARILIVDDDALVLASVQMLLVHAGHEVLAVDQARKAVDRPKNRSRVFVGLCLEDDCAGELWARFPLADYDANDPSTHAAIVSTSACFRLTSFANLPIAGSAPHGGICRATTFCRIARAHGRASS